MKGKANIEFMPNLVTKRDYKQKPSSNSCYTKLRPKSSNLGKKDSGDLIKEKLKHKNDLIMNRVTKENNLSDFQKKRNRAVSEYNQRPVSKKKVEDELSKMEYVPPPSKFSGGKLSNFEEVSDQEEQRIIDEALLVNEDDKLSIPTTAKVKQTELVVDLMEKLDEET